MSLESLGVQLEVQFLILLLVAVIVAVAVKYVRLPYTIALVLVGIIFGFTGIEEIELTKELIFFIFLPPLLFEGAIHMDLDKLRENSKIIFLLAFIGLVVATFAVGFAISELTQIPLIYAVLFGAMIMPTDPVSVLALFKKLGVSKKLTTIVEGESLFNDGTAVVIFEVVLALVLGGEGVHFDIVHTLLEFGYVFIGGLAVGVVMGYVAYGALKYIDDHLIEVLITGILAYGSFIVAESLFHVSGVMAVVAAGLLIGNRGTEFAMSPTTRISILNSWELAAFIVNSVIFLLIGIQIPIWNLYDYLNLVALAIVVVIVARVLGTYPLVWLFNAGAKKRDRISMSWQHVMNWGGLHGSIPIALLLGLPDITWKTEISSMVFGVVLFSLIVQGLTVGPLIQKLNIIEVSPQEKEYERLMARKMSAKRAIEEARDLYERKEIPAKLYEELREEYEAEAGDLKKSLSDLLDKSETKDLKEKQKNVAVQKIFLARKSAVLDALRKGIISEETASEIMEELDAEIDSRLH